MLNPFFLQGSKGEQNLVQDIINEHLKIHGVDVYYLQRKYITEKTGFIVGNNMFLNGMSLWSNVTIQNESSKNSTRKTTSHFGQ